MRIGFAALMGSLAGILGTGAGGLLAYFAGRPSRRFLSSLLSFTCGLMLAVVCFELLPHAFIAHSIAAGLAGLMLGVAFTVALDGAVSRLSGVTGALRSGIVTAFAIAAHNFPEGLAIGSGYAQAPALGFGLCLLIALHDIPEGLALGVPLRRGGVGPLKVAALAALSGVPTGLGAFLGYAAGSAARSMISLSMGVAGGSMLYLIFAELMPGADDLHRGRINGVAVCVGVAVGIGAAAFVNS